VSACLVPASTANAESFKRTASGWINRTDVDPNGNESEISIITTYGKGKFGTSVSNSTTEVEGPQTPRLFCSFDPPNIVVVRRPLLARSTVTRFSNGDLLFAELDPILSSSLCIDIRNRTTVSEVHMVITGGTGKFAGATGALLITTNGTQLHFEGNTSVHSGVTEVTEGEIFRNYYDHDDDDDDD
jgi:hypothetical protein